jgi:hypothetical protein
MAAPLLASQPLSRPASSSAAIVLFSRSTACNDYPRRRSAAFVFWIMNAYGWRSARACERGFRSLAA